MLDEIIYGNGASRRLKTVPQNSEIGEQTPADFTAFMSQLRAGTFPVDILYPYSTETEGIQQVGTRLNKETLLNTAAEASIWGDSAPPTPTPSLAFQNLGGRMNSAESSISSALSSISSLNGRMNSAESSISSALSSISSLNGRMNSAESSISNLEDFIPQIDGKLDKTGGTIIGAINMGDAGANSMSYPLYFGEDENTYIKRNGVGQLYIHNDNNIDFNNQRLTRVASPEQSTDAANKAYVDSSALSGGGLLIKFNTQVERADKTYNEIAQAIEQDIKIDLRASNTPGTTVKDYKLGQYHLGSRTIGFYNIATPTSIEDLTSITLHLLQLKLSGETETWTSKTYQISLT